MGLNIAYQSTYNVTRFFLENWYVVRGMCRGWYVPVVELVKWLRKGKRE